MPDSKITALTNLTAADAINDMFPIVDVSDNFITASGTTKRISINNLLSSSPTASGALTVTGLVTAGSAAITGALTVDTTTLVVDATNDRVGVNTATFDTNWGPKLQTSSASTDGSGGIVIESYKPNLILKDASSGAQRRHIYADGGVQYFGYGDASIAEHLSIGTTGNVSVALGNVVMGTANKGIDFSINSDASATSELLNDYEEGTWTIGLTFGGGNTALTTALSTGRYTKIGRQVTVCGRLELSNKGTSTGAAVITGLPFSIGSGNDSQQAASFRFNGVSYTGAFQGYGSVGGTTIPLEQISEAGSPTDITNSNFSNATSIQISFTYTV